MFGVYWTFYSTWLCPGRMRMSDRDVRPRDSATRSVVLSCATAADSTALDGDTQLQLAVVGSEHRTAATTTAASASCRSPLTRSRSWFAIGASKLVRGVAGNAGADAAAVAAAAAAAAAAVTTGRYCRRVSLSSRRSSWTSCLSRAATPLFRSRRTRRTRPRVPSPRTSCLPRCSARSRPARFPSHPLRSRA